MFTCLLFIYLTFILGECIAQPLTCRNGLSLGMRIKLDNVASDSNQKFIFDSGGQNGKGISVFLQDDKFFVVVGSKGLWQVSIVLLKFTLMR